MTDVVDGPLSGTVFKVERGRAGEKFAFVRLFSGTVRVGDRVKAGDSEGKITTIAVFEGGTAPCRATAGAEQIAKLWGLDVRTGDTTTATVLKGQIPAARVHELQRRLPSLTRGEGVLESEFDHCA